MSKAYLLTLIDSDVQDRLAFLGRCTSDACQEVAYITIRISDKLDDMKAKATSGRLILTPEDFNALKETGYMDVYRVVGELYGKSSRRVREYVQIYRFFAPEVWTEFDVLPFSHFEFAMSFGEKWRIILDTAVQQMDRNNGRPPSVDWLAANFTGFCQVQQDAERVQAQGELEDSNRTYESDTDALPPDIPAVEEDVAHERFALRLVARAIQPIEKYARSDKLPARVAAALDELVCALRECLTVEVN